jgi:dCTP deaminase
MSTIVDSQIENLALADNLINPYNPGQVNPASYDVRLDSKILIENEQGFWEECELPYTLQPGEFVLGCTVECLSIPNHMEAVFQLKSSRGREGYEHVLSGYIDPGFYGNLTLELVNVNRYRTLPLKTNMLIGQIRFMKTDQPVRRPYAATGHYQNDTKVQPSKTTIFGGN